MKPVKKTAASFHLVPFTFRGKPVKVEQFQADGPGTTLILWFSEPLDCALFYERFMRDKQHRIHVDTTRITCFAGCDVETLQKVASDAEVTMLLPQSEIMEKMFPQA